MGVIIHRINRELRRVFLSIALALTLLAPEGWSGSPGLSAGNILSGSGSYSGYQYLGSPSRQIDREADTIDAVWSKWAFESDRLMTISDAKVIGAVTTLLLDDGSVIQHVPIDTMGAQISESSFPPDQALSSLRKWPEGDYVVSYHSLIDSTITTQLHRFLIRSGDIVQRTTSIPPLPVSGPLGGTKLALDETATLRIYHLIACETSGTLGDAGRSACYYFRGTETKGTSVISWATPMFVDTIVRFSAVLESSPAGLGVAIVYAKPRPMATEVGDADLCYRQSLNEGVTWGLVVNLTQYSNVDTRRANLSMTAAFDLNAVLHVVYTTAEYREGVGPYPTPAHLVHWNSLRGTHRTLACADWLNTCSVSPDRPGQSYLQIDHPNLVVKPAGEGPGAGIPGEVLYCVWVQYGPTSTDCATLDSSGTPGGYVNGEIYYTASSDDGFTWDHPVNLTGTETPNCLPGACRSENYVSAAATADSGLYLSYQEDKHAGAARSEGKSSNDTYRLFVPATRPVGIQGRICLEPSGLYALSLEADGAPQTSTLRVRNIGTGLLSYTVRVTNDDSGRSHVTVDGDSVATGSVAVALEDTLIVGYDAVGLPDTNLSWRLEVTSNDPVNDPGQGGVAKNFPLAVTVTVTSDLLIGDVNGDGLVTSADIILLVNHIFKGGPPPNPVEAGDTNCDQLLTSADIILLVNYVFKGGPAPSC